MFRLLFFWGYASSLAPVCGICSICLMYHAFPWAFYRKWCGWERVCVCEYLSEDSPYTIYKSHKSQSTQIEFGIHPRRNNLFITTASSILHTDTLSHTPVWNHILCDVCEPFLLASYALVDSYVHSFIHSVAHTTHFALNSFTVIFGFW